MTSRSEFQLGAPAPTVAIVALAAVVAAILTAVVRTRPQAKKPAAEREVIEPEIKPRELPPTALALIDAIPWGRIERIVRPSGETYPLPDQRETPVLLALPAGEWRVALTSPAVDEERFCDLSLTDGARHDCLVEFERISVDEYFREAGWWR